jgi:putative transposase
VIRKRSSSLSVISIERCCQILGVSRSEYYAKPTIDAKDDLCLEIQTEADERIAYGYRRIAESLWKKGNRRATRKRVRSRMRKIGLNRRPKRRKTRTTIPGKAPASPNLVANLNLERPRQLLVTDLTYVALPQGFAYVSVVMDAFSRRALGWAASDNLATELPLEALGMVLSQESLPQGWIHHSDRGCQYTSKDYKEKVEQNFGILSNSKPGCPYDNAKMESFFKTYKYEEANLQTYSSLEDLKLNLATFLQDYNSFRLHSSIGYCSPIEFEILYNQLDKEICVC